MSGAGSTPVPPVAGRWFEVAACVLVLLAVVHMLGRAWLALRNVAHGDDIDGTLMLLLRLQDGGSWRETLGWLFELGNEHRMVTSRLLYVASYHLTGTVNFTVFGVIGNLFLVGLCALLIGAAGAARRKWTMALVLAALLFQLEHHENFFWAGSSIDHLQVPLLAGVAVVLLGRGGWWSWLGAGSAAVLAMFTLAHGVAVWPVGALMLALDRRGRQLAAWVWLGALASAVFFTGFEFNPAHQVGNFSLPGVTRIGRYWLEILGAPLALRQAPLAIVLGAALLGSLGWQVASGGLRRERVALPLALWAVAGLGLVAIGRANLGDGVLISRYYVLSALAWALVIFSALHHRREGVRLDRALRWLVPGVVAFNLAANASFAGVARKWVADRDQAVADFMRHGRDGAGPATLHPLPRHSTRVLRQAEVSGVFEMPRQAVERSWPEAAVGEGVTGSVDRIALDDRMLTIDGWAAIAGRVAKPGEAHLVLRSADSRLLLTTTATPRPDVAAAHPGEPWHHAGFHFALRRWLLPPANYQVGLFIPAGSRAEMMMTSQWVDLEDAAGVIARDKVAPNRLVYDELILSQPKSTVTAAPNKFMRVSFLDGQGGLVHIDFSGAGEMTVALDAPTPLEPPPRDRGRVIARLKGAASIAVTGADESTNLSVFAARRQPPFEARRAVAPGFDGRAHVASISIASRNGRFGGVRAGNAVFSARAGVAGVSAPNVRFAGPINIGDIHAFDTAVPVLEPGFAAEARIAGGDLHQPNGQSVRVGGIERLQFVEGRTAQGAVLPARANQARLQRDGRDVTGELTGRSE